MERKYLAVLLFLVCLLVALLGCVQQPGEVVLADDTAIQETGEGAYPNPDRDSYGTGIFIDENRNPIRKPVKEAFAELPAMPEDFGEKMHSMDSGLFNSIALGLEEEYYKQPEFLPLFEEIGLRYWQSPDLRRWGKEGFGIYPSERAHKIKPGGELYVTVFVHSAYGIESFQGLRLYSFFPCDKNAERFFSIEIEPENMLVGPTYPIVNRDWMHKVVIKIKASEEAEPGRYLIGFNAASPAAEQDNEWREEHGSMYVSGGGMFSISRPRLSIRLIVE